MNKNFIKYRLTFLTVWLIYGFLQPLIAQPRQLQFHYLTPNQGLSSSLVTTIFQDHQGFMWIGTYDGLNRYDGYSFTNYKSDAHNPHSIQCDQIRAIFQDEDNKLFIGTNCGISLYKPDSAMFYNFMEEESSVLFGVDCNIYHIDKDQDGDMWLSTNKGLLRFNLANNESEWFTPVADDPQSISNLWVEYTYTDSKGRFWVSTRGGLNLFNPENNSFELVAKGIYSNDSYSQNTFLEITEDAFGNVWFASYNGLYCLPFDEDDYTSFVYYKNDPNDPNSISANRLLSVFVDGRNNLWVGAENDGMYLHNREKDNFWHYERNDNDPAGLNNKSIQAIFMDNSENLWVGTFGGGVNISQKNSEGIIHYKNLKGSEKSLSNNLVRSFLEDSQGRIWVGTDGGGLNRFNKKEHTFNRFTKGNSGISSEAILSILEGNDKTLWMSTWGGGINHFYPKTGKFDSYTTTNSRIPENNIFSIVKGNNNDLWLGSYRTGLIHFDIATNQFKTYEENNSDIGNNYVYIIRKSPDGLLYLGSTTGLEIFSPKNESFQIYKNDRNNIHSLSHENIYDILIQDDTTVWIATQRGLNRFNPETGLFYRYYQEDGLPDNVIKGLLIDKKKNLWVTTNKGICRFNPVKKEFKIFTQEDGLQSNEFNYNSTMLSSDGNLYFGGVNGFNIFYPGKFEENKRIPEIVFTGFDLFNKPVIPNSIGSPLKTNISDCRELVLAHDQNVLTFRFAALDFTHPEKNQYAHYLEGFDNDWIYSGNKHEVTYTNLNPGEYTMHIKGSNNNGVWNDKGASINLNILPPWYQKTWVKILAILVLSGIIILIFNRRTASLKRQKNVLAEKVNERTRDLNKKNRLLQENNSLLKKNQAIIKAQSEELKSTAESLEEANKELESINATKDKLFSIIGHDLKNPFNVILGYTDLLLSNLDEWDTEQTREVLNYIKESSGIAYNLLENLLHWSRSQRGVLEFDPSPVFPNEIINLVYDEVVPFARKKGVEIINLCSLENTNINADPNMLTLICRNLLMNAIKFSDPGKKVFIDAEIHDNKHVRFSITDEGVGMDKEKTATLFDLNKTSSTRGTNGEKGTGLGLVLCHEFVHLHKGKIWVESKVGKGTSFFFTIPRA